MIGENPLPKAAEFGAFRPSIVMLVVVNTIPLIGALFWGWSTFEIVALYWLENVIIGVFNILKMVTCSPSEEAIRKMERTGRSKVQIPRGCMHGAKFFMVPFFTIHYFGFCAGHGFFVFMLLGNGGLVDGAPGSPGEIFPTAIATFTSGTMLLAIGALFASHLFSFVVNYIKKGEYQRVTPDYLMGSPYARIFILHVVIIFGAMAIMALGSPVVLLALLVILKTGMDIVLHLRSHKKAAELDPVLARKQPKPITPISS